MKKLLFVLLLILIVLPVRAEQNTFDMSIFREIPVLHEGRVKPLESFARVYLLAITGKDSPSDETSIEWLVQLLFASDKAFARPDFNIPDPQTAASIGLPWRPEHHYSFEEVSKALSRHGDTIKTLSEENDAQLTPDQRQLLDLYAKALAYGVIGESLSILRPRFKIDDSAYAKFLGVPAGQELTFLDMMPHEAQILASVRSLQNKKPGQLTAVEKTRAQMALEYLEISEHKQASLFRIVPPQWRMDNEEWLSPGSILFEGHGSPQSAEYLDLWKKLAVDYTHGNTSAWQKDSIELRDKAFELAGPHASLWRMKMEVFYQKLHPFRTALILYLVSCALLLAAYLADRKPLIKAVAILMPVGAMLHFIGIVLRIIIQNRPPVATLYETTIFVSLIAVVLSLIFAWKRRDVVALSVGAVIGAVLLFISTRYAADGDTMEMLVAVLNTNFWLATHVVAITTGYGCSLVAGTLGHVYLLSRWRHPKNTAIHTRLLNGMLAVALIAAFFAALGTILGGIWADQSWGRFWGWDPKENGAMLIVLWLLWLLHGRIAKVLSPLNFAVGVGATNIIVALSWFGVNLLSVGLHSYGFTQNIAANLALFCGAEAVFLASMHVILMRQRTA